jgi:hypothetical protein
LPPPSDLDQNVWQPIAAPPPVPLLERKAAGDWRKDQEKEPAPDARRVLLPIYRASNSYPENGISLFCTSDEDDYQPLVTVEQARREIPDYLLQISRSTTGFGSLPMAIAIIASVTIFVLFLQLLTTMR